MILIFSIEQKFLPFYRQNIYENFFLSTGIRVQQCTVCTAHCSTVFQIKFSFRLKTTIVRVNFFNHSTEFCFFFIQQGTQCLLCTVYVHYYCNLKNLKHFRGLYFFFLCSFSTDPLSCIYIYDNIFPCILRWEFWILKSWV